ncbi:MAG: HAD family phosphatase [Clostridia bacterium]|nr:HAD family phosphatase [Clostridia bacterium]
MTDKKAYIFDMDGTLIDSVYALEDGVKKYLDQEGIPYPDNIVEIITPLGYEGAAKYLQSLGLDMPIDDIVKAMKDAMIGEYQNNLPAKTFAPEVIKKLHSDGKILCVLTASPHFLTDPCLKRLGLDGLFTHIWTTDDFGLAKSDEKIYHEVAKLLGLDICDCVFVDDNLINIRAAKATGIGTVAVYDITTAASADEMKKIADRYIYSFDEF